MRFFMAPLIRGERTTFCAFTSSRNKWAADFVRSTKNQTRTKWENRLDFVPTFQLAAVGAFWSADSRNGVPCFFRFSDGRVYCEKDMAGSVRLVRK
jgi:hypothetical protein